MVSRTLLLPCAGKSSRYPGVRPKWMLTLPDGNLALWRAAASVPEDAYDRIVVAVRADHEERYKCRDVLQRVFGAAAEVLVIKHDTRGPADTVAHLIRHFDLRGPILVKDADSFFDPAPLPEGNFVSVSDVRATPQMSNVGAKSFAVVNEHSLIVQMVEKSLVSNFVSIGLYGMADAQLYLRHFDAIVREHDAGEVFVSHVLNRAIQDGAVVVPHNVKGLIDVGTLEDWRRVVRAQGTIICDIDGVVFKNHSRYFEPTWDSDEEPIAANIATLLEWQRNGAQIVFMTARAESCRARTAASLEATGLKPHALIMDCRHGRRLLVNDHTKSNPYPSAVGISVPRDSPTLGDYLKDWL